MNMKKLLSFLFVAILIVPGYSYAAKWTLKYAHVGPATAVSDDHIPGLWLKTYLESRTGGDILNLTSLLLSIILKYPLSDI